jgi:hypothetical protein
MLWPLLTTVRQPVSAMARLAAGLIVEHSPRRLGWPTPVPRRVLDFELVVRDSTARPPRRRCDGVRCLRGSIGVGADAAWTWPRTILRSLASGGVSC